MVRLLESSSNLSNSSPIRALKSKNLNSNFDERSKIVENTLVSVIYPLLMSNNITKNGIKALLCDAKSKQTPSKWLSQCSFTCALVLYRLVFLSHVLAKLGKTRVLCLKFGQALESENLVESYHYKINHCYQIVLLFWYSFGNILWIFSLQEEVMTMERILLQTIKFDLQVQHPYQFLLKYAKHLRGRYTILRLDWGIQQDFILKKAHVFTRKIMKNVVFVVKES